jgi:hypothetical protein
MNCEKKLMNEKSAMSKKSLNECMFICKIVRRVFFANKLLMMMMMKLGLRPRYSQKRNIYMGFSLQCRREAKRCRLRIWTDQKRLRAINLFFFLK